MKIVTHYELTPIPVRDYDYAAFDEDRLDGAPDAGIRSQRQGHGSTRDAAILDLVAQTTDDYTDEELAAADVEALQSGDTTTLVFVALLREQVAV